MRRVNLFQFLYSGHTLWLGHFILEVFKAHLTKQCSNNVDGTSCVHVCVCGGGGGRERETKLISTQSSQSS